MTLRAFHHGHYNNPRQRAPTIPMNNSSLPDISDVARSIELYRLGKHLHALGKQGISKLVLTREPLLRRREEVRTLVIAAGSYDPLSVAHVALFQKGREIAQMHTTRRGLEETLVLTSTAHFDKQIDLRKNAAIYDRAHSLEGFASGEGSVSLGFFNKPLFLDMARAVRQIYPHAQTYFLAGADVMEKVLNPEGYTRIGLDHEISMEQLFARSTFIVSKREMETPEGKLIVTLADLQNKYPVSLPYARRMLPLNLDDDYTSLQIPIEQVSSTVIRTTRANREPIDHLVAVGISPFVDKRSLYLQDSDKYAAFVYARQRFADEHEGEPLTACLPQLMEYLVRLDSDAELRAQEIARASPCNL